MIEYYTMFTDSLVELGSSPDIFSYADFLSELRKYCVYGVGMAFEAIPFQMMEDGETADLDAMEVKKYSINYVLIMQKLLNEKSNSF